MKTNMNAGRNESNTSFTARCLASCRELLNQLENVKEQIIDEFRDQVQEHQHLLKLAMNEAEALAWQTEYPELLFADLATEKAHAVADWHVRQQLLRSRTAPALMAA